MFSDLDLVTPVRDLDGGDRPVHPGEVGTVIYAWDGGAEVEFVSDSGAVTILNASNGDLRRSGATAS